MWQTAPNPGQTGQSKCEIAELTSDASRFKRLFWEIPEKACLTVSMALKGTKKGDVSFERSFDIICLIYHDGDLSSNKQKIKDLVDFDEYTIEMCGVQEMQIFQTLLDWIAVSLKMAHWPPTCQFDWIIPSSQSFVPGMMWKLTHNISFFAENTPYFLNLQDGLVSLAHHSQ
jgi:hypothetical protein